MMNRMSMVLAVAGVMASGVAFGQAPVAAVALGPAAEVQHSYAGVKANILKSADKMPGDGYSFKPTPDVRTYARVLNHVSEAQLRACGAANGTKDLAKVPAETADKAAIVEALNASFAECDKAFAALTDANLSETFTVGPAKRSRIGLMWGTVSHDNEQYATLALYLRLKGLVPPSSEK
ncbi:DinB family protein [Granulicella arctica]|nr:DinB family protein [Granulicella arctica]